MKKFIKVIILRLAKASGVEAHIRLQERIELANHMQVGCRYFRDSFHARSPRAANALWHFSTQLKFGARRPDLKAMVHDVWAAGGTLLFEEAKKNG